MKDTATEEFWNALDTLVSKSQIIIDRPKGSSHPRYPDIIYEVNYGYIKNSSSTDGDGIDVWLGEHGKEIVGIICTVDLIKRDSEIKILIRCNEDEIDYICRFHNDSQNMKAILIHR